MWAQNRPSASPRFEDFIAPGAETEPEADVGWHDPAFIMYTSGTTGRPKGVVRSHLADYMGGLFISVECGFRHDDVILNNKPLFHIAQLQLQFIPFVQNAATNVLTRGFDVHETLSVVGAERVTVLHGVPTQMVLMVAADLSKYDLVLAALRFLWRPDARERRHPQMHGAVPKLFCQLIRLDRSADGDLLRLPPAPGKARQRRQGLDRHGSARHPR